MKFSEINLVNEYNYIVHFPLKELHNPGERQPDFTGWDLEAIDRVSH